MRSVRLLAVIAALANGCVATARPMVPGPLDTQGELHVQILPPSAGAAAANFAFHIDDLSAIRADGAELPLRLERTSVSPAEIKEPRALAWGRLEPGDYAGLSVRIGKTSRLHPEGVVAAPAPQAPLRVDAPFTIERRRALLLRLDVRAAPSAALASEPVFVALPSQRPLPQLAGFVSTTALHEVAVFDKRAHALAAVVPAGRDPWGIALDPVESRVYVALSGEDQVQVLDLATLEEHARIRLQPGDAPREIQLTPDRRLLLVANSGSNSVSFVDPRGMLEIGRTSVGDTPTGLLIDRAGTRAYVFNTRSTFVSIIDIAGRVAVGSVATEYGPLRGQLNRDGDRLYVLSTHSAYLTAFALPGMSQVGRVYVGLGTSGIKVDPVTDLLYVAQPGARRLAVFHPFSLLPVDSVEVPGDGTYMAIADAEGALFVLLPERRSAAVIDLASRRLLAEIDLGPGPRVVAVAGERH